MERQYNALKEVTVQHLYHVADLIESGSFHVVQDSLLFFSPAGDEMGRDNSGICFAFLGNGFEDISDVLDKLIDLEKKLWK